MRSRLLFVSGSPDDARHLSRMLHAMPIRVDHARNLQGAKSKLQQYTYSVVLTEAALPDGRWVDVLNMARECPQYVEVIVTDPQADARFWAEVLNLGAYDVLAQPFYEPEVRRILHNACFRHGTQAMTAT